MDINIKLNDLKKYTKFLKRKKKKKKEEENPKVVK